MITVISKRIVKDPSMSSRVLVRLIKEATRTNATELLDDHRGVEPPDPIPNSEVKSAIADGSVGDPM